MDRCRWIWPVSLLAALGLLMLPGCETGGDTEVEEEPLVDTDGDGLYDSFEDEDIGTDPTLDDTDGDGYFDGDEWSLFTDPLDPADFEYVDADGAVVWNHYPYPADLESTGTEVGEIPPNFALPNYWGQDTSLYSFYGNVIHVIMTANS